MCFQPSSRFGRLSTPLFLLCFEAARLPAGKGLLKGEGANTRALWIPCSSPLVKVSAVMCPVTSENVTESADPMEGKGRRRRGH